MIAHASIFVEQAIEAVEAAVDERHHASGRPLPSPSAPLTNGQKARLCILAREAFDDLIERGALDVSAFRTPHSAFDEWRHDQQLKACGVSSLRAATQREYMRLIGHYKGLLGRMNQAMRAIERGMTEGRRLAMFKLKEALAERGLGESYAAAICRRQFRRGLAEATEKQVWCLVFTVRNRRKAGGSQPSAVSQKPVAAVCDRRTNDNSRRSQTAATVTTGSGGSVRADVVVGANQVEAAEQPSPVAASPVHVPHDNPCEADALPF